MSTVSVSRFTIPQYLEIERSAQRKSEYYRGQIFLMSGASREHNLIVANLMRHLGNHFADKPCLVFPSDMRVRCPSDLFTYPDASIVCGEEQYDDQHFDTLLNPTVLFEVLSPFTGSYDCNEKSGHYREISSLREYVLIAQDQCRVEHFLREQDSSPWKRMEYQSLTDELALATGDVRLSLASLYAHVEFDSTAQDSLSG